MRLDRLLLGLRHAVLILFVFNLHRGCLLLEALGFNLQRAQLVRQHCILLEVLLFDCLSMSRFKEWLLVRVQELD